MWPPHFLLTCTLYVLYKIPTYERKKDHLSLCAWFNRLGVTISNSICRKGQDCILLKTEKFSTMDTSHFLCPLMSTLVYHVSLLPWIATPWTWEWRYVLYSVFTSSGYTYPEAETLDHMVHLALAFWGIPIPLAIIASVICIPTNSILGSPFLPHSLFWKHFYIASIK